MQLGAADEIFLLQAGQSMMVDMMFFRWTAAMYQGCGRMASHIHGIASMHAYT